MKEREMTLKEKIVEFLDHNASLENEDKADLICVIMLNHLVESLREGEGIHV